MIGDAGQDNARKTGHEASHPSSGGSLAVREAVRQGARI